MCRRISLLICFLLFIDAAFGETPALAQTSQYTRFNDQAADIASRLSDSELVAQVLLTGIDGKTSLVPAMRTILLKIPVGGVLLFKYNLDTSKEDVKKLLSETAGIINGKTGIPPFIAVDHEGGLVHRFGAGVMRLPSAFSFWELAGREGRGAALKRAESLYLDSAREIRELGITMVLGPVAEILNDENRVFLDTRSYGPDAAFCADAASVFVRSMEAAGIASVVKHFPGNTAADPHDGISTLGAAKPALGEMVKPFADLIGGPEPPAMMISHVMVPAVDGERNASLSARVIEGWLRGELGFKGIAIADDYSMGAIASRGLSPEAAAIEALNSGVDMIMVWPKNITPVHAAILEALKDGRLSRERLLEAAGRIIAGKIRYGLVSE